MSLYKWRLYAVFFVWKSLMQNKTRSTPRLQSSATCSLTSVKQSSQGRLKLWKILEKTWMQMAIHPILLMIPILKIWSKIRCFYYYHYYCYYHHHHHHFMILVMTVMMDMVMMTDDILLWNLKCVPVTNSQANFNAKFWHPSRAFESWLPVSVPINEWDLRLRDIWMNFEWIIFKLCLIIDKALVK